MKFESKKDLFVSAIIFGVCCFLMGMTIVSILNGSMKKDEFWTLIPILVVVGFLLWLYFGTNYELTKENGLIYKSGPIKGKISVHRITEIVKGKTLWAGLQPATSRKGQIIKYDKYNEIYISPKTNESFINKVLELNGQIKITE